MLKHLAYFGIILSPATSFGLSEEIYFSSYPCLSPDGKTIVFTYESDLWQVSAEGGTALRLTSMQGEETRAKFSPDGKWIAFTGSQNGNQDVYLISSEGGEIKQLTFHESFDQVDNWSWDSKTIYFTSGRYNRFSGYSVSVDGETPVRLFEHFFHTVHNLTEHPNGELFFNESWESKTQWYRKRYKGAFNPEIQSYHPVKKELKRYTDYEGKDMWPTIDKDGNIYFVSDENNGENNLYTLKDGKKFALTTFTTSIRFPVTNANGGFIVFEKDYQIYLYNVKTSAAEKVKILANSNSLIEQEKNFDIKEKISYFDVSQDGKKFAFVSRGVLFVSDLKGKFIKRMDTNPGARVLEVKWLSDNKKLLYSQTNANGFTNWFVISGDNSDKEKQITNEDQNSRNITFNHDLTKGVFLRGRNDVCIIDLKTFEVQKIVNEELWGFYNSTPMFSPNGEYVLFTAMRDFEDDIFLYNLSKKTLVNITNTAVAENNPFWSPDGKYIYFTSNRFEPGYPYGRRNSHIYRISLEKLDKSFLSDGFKKIFEEDTSKKNESEKKTTNEIKSYTIEWDGLFERIELVSTTFGTQGEPQVFLEKDKTLVFYPSDHVEGKYNLWMTTYEEFESVKTEKIEGADAGESFIVKSGDKYYCLINGSIHSLNPDSKKTEKIGLSGSFSKNMRDEFNQMFAETWANVKENFYDENFHGIDWEKKRNQYAAFLPEIRSRSDLRILISDMLGELNASHTGFYSYGDEEKTYYSVVTLAPGILFENKNPYVVSGIVKDGPADKKGISILPGDILSKVNDISVDKNKSRESYFVKPSMANELSLTFLRGKTEYTVKIHPASYYEINELQYDEWIDDNQKRVDEKSKNRIAYSCMKNMMDEEFDKFLLDMTREANQRDGLILDLRYNVGGNVHNKVLQFLSQEPYMKWKYREGKFTMQPTFSMGNKPIVLLINEQSLSDAEMTAGGFKELKLGKIIGTETYRWIIFTGGKGLVDGSSYRLPSWGCYTLQDENIEIKGVAPDISVPLDFQHRVKNEDPQLDRAIEEIMKDLK